MYIYSLLAIPYFPCVVPQANRYTDMYAVSYVCAYVCAGSTVCTVFTVCTVCTLCIVYAVCTYVQLLLVPST